MFAGRRKLVDGITSLDNEGHTADGSLKRIFRKVSGSDGENALIARDWPIDWAAATRWYFL